MTDDIDKNLVSGGNVLGSAEGAQRAQRSKMARLSSAIPGLMLVVMGTLVAFFSMDLINAILYSLGGDSQIVVNSAGRVPFFVVGLGMSLFGIRQAVIEYLR